MIWCEKSSLEIMVKPQMVQFFFQNRTFSLSHFVEVICGNKYFRLKLTVRLFCLRSRLCNHKMWKCIWCQPDLSLITKEQTWLYIHKKHDFCLNFCRLAHTNTLKKLGSLFDLPQIPDLVSREAIMHHGSALWQKKLVKLWWVELFEAKEIHC